jgi:type IX secretion system PorP/SprF family membrane protein
MTLKKLLITLFLIPFPVFLAGQDTWYGGTAGMRSVFNPGFCGAAGENRLYLTEYNFLPGQGFNLNSISALIDYYMPSMHGGTSAWITDDIMGGVINDMRAGVAYAYHFRAGNNVFVTAGLTASVIHIGINQSKVVLPDDLDPFKGLITSSGETLSGYGLTRFDTGSGLTISSGEWYGGFAVSHLNQPYLSDNRQKTNRLQRKYCIEGGSTFTIGENKTELQPWAMLIFQGESFIGTAGAMLTRRQISGGISTWFIRDGFAAIQPMLGWHNEAASVGLSYSYNLGNAGTNLSSTALIRASVTIVLNNVEKRKVIHVIKLPEL